MTTLATLLLELSLTRIFSVVFYYHFAFLAISIALFGLGAGGVLLVRGGRLEVAAVRPAWAGSACCNSLLVVVALVILLAQNNNPSNWDLALIYFTTALPFFVSGTIVSLAICETIAHVHRVYFFDLMGAAAGCLLLYPLLNGFGGVSTVLGAAITFAVAAAIWHSISGSVRGRVAIGGAGAGAGGVSHLNQRYHVIDIRHAKGQTIDHEIFQHWNVFSRDRSGGHPQPGPLQHHDRRRRRHRHRQLRFRPPHRRPAPRADGRKAPRYPTRSAPAPRP